MDDNQDQDSAGEIFEFPSEGPWGAIARGKDTVTYCPRNPSKLPRFERTLPSGQVLVDDVVKGFVLRSVFTARFNLKTNSPVGREMGDRAILKRQTENLPWFVSWYQEVYDNEDRLESSCLRLVEENLGRTLVKIYEFPEPPTIDVPR